MFTVRLTEGETRKIPHLDKYIYKYRTSYFNNCYNILMFKHCNMQAGVQFVRNN